MWSQTQYSSDTNQTIRIFWEACSIWSRFSSNIWFFNNENNKNQNLRWFLRKSKLEQWVSNSNSPHTTMDKKYFWPEKTSQRIQWFLQRFQTRIDPSFLNSNLERAWNFAPSPSIAFTGNIPAVSENRQTFCPKMFGAPVIIYVYWLRIRGWSSC